MTVKDEASTFGFPVQSLTAPQHGTAVATIIRAAPRTRAETTGTTRTQGEE
jgi:hypothetical protein